MGIVLLAISRVALIIFQVALIKYFLYFHPLNSEIDFCNWTLLAERQLKLESKLNSNNVESPNDICYQSRVKHTRRSTWHILLIVLRLIIFFGTFTCASEPKRGRISPSTDTLTIKSYHKISGPQISKLKISSLKIIEIIWSIHCHTLIRSRLFIE